MARVRSTPVRRPSSALDRLVREGDGVLLHGLEHLGEDAWAVLANSGLRLLRVTETVEAVEAVAEGAAQTRGCRGCATASPPSTGRSR